MAPKRKLIPPLRPNADGTGFVRVGAVETGSRGPRDRLRGPCRAAGAPPQRGTSSSPRGGGRGGAALGSSSTSTSTSSSASSTSTSSSASPSRAPASDVASPTLSRTSKNTPQQQPTTTGNIAVGTRRQTAVPPIGKPQLQPKQPQAQKATGSAPPARHVDSALPSKWVQVTLVADRSLLSNECRASAALLRRLAAGGGAGALVACTTSPPPYTEQGSGRGEVGGASEVLGTAPVAILEAFLSTANRSGDALVVSDETKSVLLGSGAAMEARRTAGSGVAFVSLVKSSTPLAQLQSLQLQAFLDTESGLVAHHFDSARSNGAPCGAQESLQWCALFRHSFRNRVVFAGMRSTLRAPSSHSVVVEVTSVRPAPVISSSSSSFPTTTRTSCCYGILGAGTHVSVGETAATAASGESENKRSEAAPTAHSKSMSRPATHTLVIGESGTGKSFYLEMEAKASEARGGQRALVVRVEELTQGEGSEVATATAVREVFAAAKQSAPSTVFLDDLHLICCGTSRSGGAAGTAAAGSDWAVAHVTTALCEELRDIAVRSIAVRVVASAPARDALPSALLTPERLGAAVVHLTPPATAEEREVCLKTCLVSSGLLSSSTDATTATTATSLPMDVVREVAHNGHGFTQRDLARVVEAAMMECFKRCGTTAFKAEDLRAAAKMIHPSSLRQFEVSVPDITWDDIGGSETPKRTLQEVVEWCLGKQSWVFKDFNLTPPKGVLLYGPPGCSKTMLAKALANESRMNFVSVKGPEVFSKWVGDSEKAVRDIFSRARAAAPCVVFIDELDGMCGHRGRGGVSDRVISQFLTELDGLPSAMQEQEAEEGKKPSALVFVAATNRPDNIDGAVLRPGRIDRRVHVGLPALAEREAIVRIQLRRLPAHADLTPSYVAERTDGYTGAEVVAVVKEAAFTAVTTDMAAVCVTTQDVDRALQKVRPRVDRASVEWYKNWPHNTKEHQKKANA